jgi:hypothetical protein
MKETLGELNRRIAIIRENLRELIEQAATYSGRGRRAHRGPHRRLGRAARGASQDARCAAG